MSERLGPMTYTQDTHSAHLDLGFGPREREFSEKTAQSIDEEIAGIIDATHQKVIRIITEERAMLEKLARILLEKESIDGEELKNFADAVKEKVAEKTLRPAVA